MVFDNFLPCVQEMLWNLRQTLKKWTSEEVITGNAGTPRSYVVNTGSGTYRRNRRHLDSTGTTRTEHDNKDAGQTETVAGTSPDTSPASPEVMPDASPVPLRRSTRTITKPERLIEHSWTLFITVMDDLLYESEFLTFWEVLETLLNCLVLVE